MYESFLNELGNFPIGTSPAPAVSYQSVAYQSVQPCTIHRTTIEESICARRVICNVDLVVQLLQSTCYFPGCLDAIEVTKTITWRALSLQWHCSHCHSGKCSSSRQAYSENAYPFFENNLLMAAGILISGNNYGKIASLFKILEIASIKSTTY